MAFYRKNGRIDAACTVNRSREATIVKHLLDNMTSQRISSGTMISR
jgi:hypothetical protein